MQKQIKISTGFSFLDQKWGGVYQGGNYLIFGSKKSGKTILSLKIIENLIHANFNILLFSSERKKSLEIQASSIYFDLPEALSNGLLTIQKFDNSLNSFDDLKEIIQKNNPSVIFFDEIISEKFITVKNNYLNFLEFLEDSNITAFFVSSIPPNDETKFLVKKIAKYSTAIIQLQKNPNRNYSGVISLKPNVGHFEGEFETTYKVEPSKGFITLADNESIIVQMLGRDEEENIYKRSKNFDYTNIYSLEEFNFLVESLKAFSDQTGKQMSVISYKILDESITSIELCSKIREKLDIADKLSFSDNVVYILPNVSENEKVQKMASDLDKHISKLFNNSGNIENHLNKKIQQLNHNFKTI